MNKSPFTLAGLGIGVVLFFAVNVLSSSVLRARADFTDEDLYTLSDGAAAIATKLDEPVNLYYYFSEKVASKFPEYRSYGLRVREMLEEFEREAGGNLILETIEPERFSEEEDKAVEEGLYGAQTPSGDNLYLGLVGTNSTDLREKIAFFQPQKERFLEPILTGEEVWCQFYSEPAGGSEPVGVRTAGRELLGSLHCANGRNPRHGRHAWLWRSALS